ncbi:MAG: DUF2029 domain-containing protein [Candidatus Moduliflexus flocculans]|nr:DUF2029 domain-containing protein [Candidatus Moduliflexus flocculans]
MLYYTTQGLIRGVDVYDHAGKMQMINDVYGADVDESFIPQFAYPPWYALSTVYLGLFPIRSAAVLWFEINLAMLFLSVWFLTDGWKPSLRLLAFPAALFFYPVLGTLAVGQYDFPVLLGASMLVYALLRRRPVLIALGMAFLTFKPHLGGLILLAVLVYLLLHRDEFGKKRSPTPFMPVFSCFLLVFWRICPGRSIISICFSTIGNWVISRPVPSVSTFRSGCRDVSAGSLVSRRLEQLPGRS